ncbi:MAG: S8 family serine peptidase [candidate division KSB1 bacterium]|nr:S8 family serine peptidase [candidate division KSB1 bacterium]
MKKTSARSNPIDSSKWCCNSRPGRMAGGAVFFRGLFFVLLLVAHPGFSQIPTHETASSSVAGEWIVKLRDGALLAKTAAVPALRRILATVLPDADAARIARLFPQAAPEPFRRILIFRPASGTLSRDGLQALRAHEAVEYIQPNHVFRIHQISGSDPLLDEAWGRDAIRLREAWRITTGSPDIPVAIIDTGVDYRHPDLAGQLWINPGEDINGNGRADSSDFNGVDDDGNGFVDDVHGWDFTDAPTFADGGDYQTRDADPMDENGHGTMVAGIIAARAGNGIGVGGVAPQTRIMNLRAGTSLGFLEEDDVAAAILYAVQNGARVINMSFGDVVVSPLLRDVVQFAHARGVVLVASSGNSGSDEPHYPSGFTETISVGAVTPNRGLAGFSNYGTTLDLVAPGQAIVTTQLNGQYGRFSGTSAAAPFVSGVAALALSRHPDWGPEIVRAVLTSTAQDLGNEGWDLYYGAGLLDARAALQVEDGVLVRIDSPAMDAGFARGPVPIIGTAAGAFVESVILSYGVGTRPESWNTLRLMRQRQVLSDTLAVWDIETLPDTTYTLRLQAILQNRARYDDFTRVILDRTPPRILSTEFLPMLDGDHRSVLLQVQVDDLSRATLHWRPADTAESFRSVPLRFETREHRFNFSELLSSGRDVELFFDIENCSGLRTRSDFANGLYRITFGKGLALRWSLQQTPVRLPSGILMPRTTDFNHNGGREIAMARYADNGLIGPIALFEWTPAGFQLRFQTGHRGVPRDMGDADADGLFELLGGLGQTSFIYEATRLGGFPERIVWIDSSDFWAARYADLDQDGRMEIIGRRGDVWQVLENTGDNRFEQVAELPNPTAGSNLTGVPHVEIADYDGDGSLELLYGDYDGDIVLYEAEGDDRFRHTWSDSLPLMDTIDFLTSGDFDGDGRADFAVASHSDPALNQEHELDARHWLVRVYTATGNDEYAVLWQQRFFGFQSPRDFDSGLGSGDLDGDGRDELIVSVFPDVYVFAYEPASGNLQAVWYDAPSVSNTALVADMGNGAPRLYLNRGEAIEALRLQPDVQPLASPAGLRVAALGETRVRLQWLPVSAAIGYRVYRGSQPDSLQFLAETAETALVDTTAVAGRRYYYAVSALTGGGVESRQSAVVSVVPHRGPRLVQAQFVSPRFISLLFDRALAEEARNPVHFRLQPFAEIASVALAQGGRELIVSFAALSPGAYQLRLDGVTDADGAPLAEAVRVDFQVPPSDAPFYLVAARALSPSRIRLRFSDPVDPATALQPENYRLSEPLVLERVEPVVQEPHSVDLMLAPVSRLGALGRDYRVVVRGVKSRDGRMIRRGEGDTAGLLLAAEKLGKIIAYPNPFNMTVHESAVIAGLTRRAEVLIFDESGRLVCRLTESDGNGGVPWNGRDDNGVQVPAGIYIILARDLQGGQATTKLAVVR